MTANIQPGEVLLVHGGGSGIGTMAVQLGREVGARVAVTAGSPEKLEVCRELGASILVNYRSEDFEEVVRAATDGHGADVILDTIGAKYLARTSGCWRSTAGSSSSACRADARPRSTSGRCSPSAARSSPRPSGRRPAAEKAAIVAAVREHVWPLVEAGRVRPIVHEHTPSAEAAQAHREMEASTHVGKLLLRV